MNPFYVPRNIKRTRRPRPLFSEETPASPPAEKISRSGERSWDIFVVGRLHNAVNELVSHMMSNNPYQPPQEPDLATAIRRGRLAARWSTILSRYQLALVFLAAGILYLEGRIHVLARPEFAGLFGLAFLSGVPAGLFRPRHFVRTAAVLLNLVNFGVWMIYVLPLVRNPRLTELTGLAIGVEVIVFSAATALLVALTPNDPKPCTNPAALH